MSEVGICDVALSPLAGQPAPKEMLIDVTKLGLEYLERQADLSDPNKLVSFGTSGHRRTPLCGTFTEAHILAITQAICDYRRVQLTDGPPYMGKDTHAVSTPALRPMLLDGAARQNADFAQIDGVVDRGPGELFVALLGGGAAWHGEAPSLWT